MITADAIPVASPDVITRPDAAGFLLFQVRTDEMHLVTPAGHVVWSLCDGSRTVHEIVDAVAPETARDDVLAFLAELADRALVELWT